MMDDSVDNRYGNITVPPTIYSVRLSLSVRSFFRIRLGAGFSSFNSNNPRRIVLGSMPKARTSILFHDANLAD